MIYQLRYKCDFKYDSYLPHITYKYRKIGKFFWEKKCTIPIDDFAYFKWKNEYYEFDRHCHGRSDSAVTQRQNLDGMLAYSRMCIMRNILDEKYDGNLESYVKSMVEFDIMADMIREDINKEAFDICLSFVTDGWKTTTVEVKETAENTGA